MGLLAIFGKATDFPYNRRSSRPSDAAVAHPFRGALLLGAVLLPENDPAVQTGRERMEPHETRYSPRLSRRNSPLRLRPQFLYTLDHQGRHAQSRNLLQLPPFLHRQTKAD